MPKILLNKSNVDLDYPICRPSLDLDFTQEVLDERITFSRGSIGTRVNRNRLIETVDANQPRFDYDPVTGECKGLLIEESRQNLLTYSEDFSNVIWTKFNLNLGSTFITSPNGQSTAYKLIANSTNFVHQLYFVSSGTINTTYTLSMYVKSGEYSRFGFGPGNAAVGGNDRIVRINLNATNPILSQDAIFNNSAFVTSVGNGWYRVGATWTATSTGTMTIGLLSRLQNNSGSDSFSGDGTSGIYIWGAQLETGSFPTSYIPTVASTVTRSAELADMRGSNFSSWYNQNEGTFYISGNASYSFQRSFGASIFNSAAFADNRISIRMGNTFIRAGAEQFAVFPQQTKNSWKLSLGLKQNDVLFVLDGSRYTPDKRVTLPTNLDTLEFGKIESVSTSLFLNGTLNRFTYYPRRLKDNQLVLLTQ